MMSHPNSAKKWAFFLKPEPTEAQVIQAHRMREAKQRKRDYLDAQGKLFNQDEFDTE